MVLGDAVDEDGLIVDAVELVGDDSVDGGLDCAGWEFGDDNTKRRLDEDEAAVRLLLVERASGVVEDGAVWRDDFK